MSPVLSRLSVAPFAVFALAGAAHAFVVNQAVIQPNQSISPDIGQFTTQDTVTENRFLVSDITVNRDYATWDPVQDRPLVDDTTYLAMDSYGPSNFTGLSDPGPGGTNPAPLGTFGLGGPGLSTGSNLHDALGPAIIAGSAGVGWGAGSDEDFMVPFGINYINGTPFDSVWIGHFVVPAGATLTGAPLLVQIDGTFHELPIDPLAFPYRADTGGFGLAVARTPAGPYAPAGAERLDLFVIAVPTPAPILLSAFAAPALTRRRPR